MSLRPGCLTAACGDTDGPDHLLVDCLLIVIGRGGTPLTCLLVCILGRIAARILGGQNVLPEAAVEERSMLGHIALGYGLSNASVNFVVRGMNVMSG